MVRSGHADALISSSLTYYGSRSDESRREEARDWCNHLGNIKQSGVWRNHRSQEGRATTRDPPAHAFTYPLQPGSVGEATAASADQIQPQSDTRLVIPSLCNCSNHNEQLTFPTCTSPRFPSSPDCLQEIPLDRRNVSFSASAKTVPVEDFEGSKPWTYTYHDGKSYRLSTSNKAILSDSSSFTGGPWQFCGTRPLRLPAVYGTGS